MDAIIASNQMTTKYIPLAAISLAASVIVSQAQTNAPSASAPTGASTPKLSPLEQSIADIKHPVPWMTWGADLRVRNEYYNNAVTHSDSAPLHEQDYFRFRSRIWTAITPIDDLTLNARLTAEPRNYLNPSDSGFYKGRTGTSWNYGIIDILNIQWRNIMALPLSFTVGRQEIFLNDNWLTGDGTPLDGSWTAFTDAGRLTYELKDQHTTIDLIGIMQDALNNGWLPDLNNQTRGLTDQNEKGAILNISNKSIKEANVDAYFMYKGDSKVNVNPPPGLRGDNANIYTLGSRLSGLVCENWKYSVEAAYQFGEKQDTNINQNVHNLAFHDIHAYGANSRLTYLFNDSMKNAVTMSYEFLSGDKPGTGNYEMFDVLWGRYPRWSDLVNVQGNVTESRVAQIGNLHRFGPSWTFTPVNKLDMSLNYFVLFADQEVPTQANKPVYSRDNPFRGNLLTGIARYKFNQHLSALLQGEVLFPGDFYKSKDTESFVRAELNFTF